MSALPDGFVLDAPTAAAALPDGFALDAPKPTGFIDSVNNAADKTAQFLSTAGAKAAGGLSNLYWNGPVAAIQSIIDPETTQKQYAGGTVLNPGGAVEQSVYKNVMPEYQPTSAAGRIGLATTAGALAGGPFGVAGAALGAAGGSASQGTAELGGNKYWQLAAGLAPALLGKPANAALNLTRSPETQAASLIRSRLESDAAAGGPTAHSMGSDLAGANGAPLTLADVGGEATKGLAEKVATAPGQGRQIATQFLNDRDAAAGPRLVKALDDNISNGGDAFTTAKALSAERSTAAQPLYQQAFQGGSIAPLESQLRDSLQSATGAKGQIAKQIAQIEQNNPGALAARGAAGADTRARYMQLHQDLAQAEQDRVATLDMFNKAKSDASANAPGAVWNPRIQQFLDDPIMKQGLATGLKIQRLEALAQGKPFNPTEYAITGYDQAGEPVVGNVPNMRTLDAAKAGLDNIVESYRDGTTGKLNLDRYGNAVNQVRAAFIKELDKVNPDYAVARNAWAGPSQSLDAMRRGQNFQSMRPELIADTIKNMTDSEKEFFKLGAADALRQSVAKTSSGGNEALRIVGNDYVKQQLRPLFSSDEAYGKFIGAAQNENRMFQTRQQMIGNSRTAARLAEANAGEGSGFAGPAMQGAMALATHEPVLGIGALLRAGGKAYEKLAGPSPATNAATARMLFNPAISPQQLQQIMAARLGQRFPLSPGLLAPSMLNPPNSGLLGGSQ